VRAHKRALAEGGELRLLMPASAAVLSVFAVTGIDRLIPSFTDPDRAWNRRRSPPSAAAATASLAGQRAPARTGCRPSLALDPAWPEGYPVGARLLPRPVPHRSAALPWPGRPDLGTPAYRASIVVRSSRNGRIRPVASAQWTLLLPRRWGDPIQ